MDSKCFIPSCENTTGVSFPDEPDLKEKWLDSLRLTGSSPSETSFVCLDHFSISDIVDDASGTTTVGIREGAIPTVMSNLSQTDDENVTVDPENVISSNENENVISNDTDLNETPVIMDTSCENTADADLTDAPIIMVQTNEELTDNDGWNTYSDSCIGKEILDGSSNSVEMQDQGNSADGIPQESVTVENSAQDISLDILQTTEESMTLSADQEMSLDNIEIAEKGAEDDDPSAVLEAVRDSREYDQSEQEVGLVESFDFIDPESGLLDNTDNTNQITETCENYNNEGVEIENGGIEIVSNELLSLSSHVEGQQSEQKQNIKLDKVCRLCLQDIAEQKNRLSNVLEGDLTVKEVINQCLHPFKVSEHDHLPQNVCESCNETLRSFHTFRKNCFQTFALLQSNTSKNVKKRKAEEFSGGASKKFYSGAITSDADLLKILEDDPAENRIGDVLITKKPLKPKSKYNVSSNQLKIVDSAGYRKSSLKAISTAHYLQSPFGRRTVSKSFPRKVEGEVAVLDEETRKILQDQIGDDFLSAENIIIEVQSDEEEKYMPNKQKVTVKQVNYPSMTPRSAEGFYGQRAVKNFELGNLNLPKDIKIKYKSNTGSFRSEQIMGLYDTEFCKVDGYLFEYRLSKGRTRYLRCIVASCPSLAQQSVLKATDNIVAVYKAHNHERPSGYEMKKQMFYYVMKRKLQSDKTLNFRRLYEDVCSMDPTLRRLVPLRSVINELCHNQTISRMPVVRNFDEFYDKIEDDGFRKLHFTQSNKQFYQEKFTSEDGEKAVIFANKLTIEEFSQSNVMYVDASFLFHTNSDLHLPFTQQLVTVLVWIDECYYPIMFALVSRKTQPILTKVFMYLRDTLAPELQPFEIITDYEANVYYSLAETYLQSQIGGSCFYFTQNLYKKVCSLNLSKNLEGNSFFRKIYHMLLMLPLLPVNTIEDGLNNIELQCKEMGLTDLTKPLIKHIRTRWINQVTPALFCIHRLENRINESVVVPFKKLRDLLMITKSKLHTRNTINIVERLIDLESFMRFTYSSSNKRTYGRDVSSSHKRNVIRAWQYIESHPRININNFFTKVLGYIKSMENQLWIWGFYRYTGSETDELIDAANFSIVNVNEYGEVLEEIDNDGTEEGVNEYVYQEIEEEEGVEGGKPSLIMEATVDEGNSADGYTFIETQNNVDSTSSQNENDENSDDEEYGTVIYSSEPGHEGQGEPSYLNYVFKEEM